MNKLIAGTVLVAALPTAHAAQPSVADLAGSWTLEAADLQRPDGSLERDYGAVPRGRLLIDKAGHYALHIYKSERLRFAAGDKAKGTEAEFKDAVMGSSTHYGSVAVEGGELVFSVEASAFPNWEGTVQRRHFTLEGDMLSYRVPPRADGGVPISVWRRVQ
jgi:hypothetical protein